MESTLPRAAAPLYALYGEQHGHLGLDGLHCESIADRSRLHNWEIQPHRHDGLHQLLVIRRGQARVLMDGEQQVLRGPAMVWVPALSVHGFGFSPATQGLVLTLDAQLPARLLKALPELPPLLATPRALALPRAQPATARLLAAADLMAAEYQALGQPWRAAALEAALLGLLLAAARLWPRPMVAAPAAPAGRALRHLARLRELIEQHYRRQPALGELAAELGITPTQLNRICRQLLGRSALQALHQRLLLEAQRELSYTNLSIQQIADGLGFADPAYFTRFFVRHTGQPPGAWRKAR